MKMQPATDSDVATIDGALSDLRSARTRLVEAKATKAAGAVRRAIKSAEGARRHVEHRLARTETRDRIKESARG